MEEWKTYKLGDVCKIYGRIGFRGYTIEDLVEDSEKGAISLSPTNIQGGVLDLSKPTYISWEKYYESPEIMIHENDIVIVKTGSSIGRTAIIRNITHPMTLNPQLVVLKDVSINKHFLGYLVKGKDFQGKLSSIVVGSAIPTLSQKNLANLTIAIPPTRVQEKIANILSSLDSKIELNNHINHNLEEQAQALYKSWFVDFEPFKDGKFVESELGMIPEGWRVVSLGEIASISKRTITPSKHPDTVFKHYSIPAYDSTEMPENQKGADILSNKFILEGNSVLFSKLNPRIRRIWVVNGDVTNSICSTEFVIYLSKIKDEYPFLCSIVQSDKFYADIMSKVNGATGSHQRFHPEESLEFRIPYNPNTVEHFSRLITPIREMKDILKRESAQLTIERDTLLPRLMSGELKINEIDC